MNRILTGVLITLMGIGIMWIGGVLTASGPPDDRPRYFHKFPWQWVHSNEMQKMSVGTVPTRAWVGVDTNGMGHARCYQWYWSVRVWNSLGITEAWVYATSHGQEELVLNQWLIPAGFLACGIGHNQSIPTDRDISLYIIAPAATGLRIVIKDRFGNLFQHIEDLMPLEGEKQERIARISQYYNPESRKARGTDRVFTRGDR